MPIASPLISLILVSCNSATHLPRCFEHLRAQTFHNFRVILVDNGLNDTAALDLVNILPIPICASSN
ncbi:MAG: glycosyltransferase family 2 protein [Chloroflexi bacterium]|nr:glycosyltransferase family 2 protein [Chloroflexota bacterium]